MRRTEIGCVDIGGTVVAVADLGARHHTGCGRGNSGYALEAVLWVGSVDCPAAVAVTFLGAARREPFARVGGMVSQDLVESPRAHSVVAAGRLAAAVAVQAMEEHRSRSVSTGPNCDGSGHSPRDCGAAASPVAAQVAAAGHPVGRLRTETDIRCVASVHR